MRAQAREFPFRSRYHGTYILPCCISMYGGGSGAVSIQFEQVSSISMSVVIGQPVEIVHLIQKSLSIIYVHR